MLKEIKRGTLFVEVFLFLVLLKRHSPAHWLCLFNVIFILARVLVHQAYLENLLTCQ